MRKLGQIKLAASAHKLYSRVKQLGVLPNANTDWRWLGRQMNTGGTQRPGGELPQKYPDITSIGGGTEKFRQAAANNPRKEVGEIRKPGRAPHTVLGNRMNVVFPGKIKQLVSLQKKLQGASSEDVLMRGIEQAQKLQEARKGISTTHSHPVMGRTTTDFKDSINKGMVEGIRNPAFAGMPNFEAYGDKLESSIRFNPKILPSPDDNMVFGAAGGKTWHGIHDPVKGETFHLRPPSTPYHDFKVLHTKQPQLPLGGPVQGRVFNAGSFSQGASDDQLKMLLEKAKHDRVMRMR